MRQIRRICTAILVLLGAIVVVPALGGTASAHHSNITASVACSGTVSWTATSWATGPSGTNTDIRVFKQIGSTTTQIGSGAFNNANNYQFSGTFAWPANTASMIISSQPFAAWGNGVVSNVGSSVTISKPANCPSQPGVTQSVSCVNTGPGSGDGKVVLTLTNNAGPYGADVTFKVYNPDQTTTFASYTVPTGGSTPVTFSGLGDSSHTVKILVGTADFSQTFTIDCDSPIPAVTSVVTCANGDGQVVVTLKNTGGEAVVFDVTNPTTLVVEHVAVNPNSTTTRTFGGFADGAYTVTIKVGATDFSQTFTIDCDHPLPKVTSSVVCGNDHDGAVTITLANEGTEAVVFHVTNPNTGVVEDVPVGIGGSTTRTYGGFTDGAHSVTVTADGQDFTQTFTVNCDLAPSYSHVEACATGDGNVEVTMVNNGDDVDAVFVLDGTSYTLAPGATKVVTLTGLADGSHTVPLTVNGADKSFTIAVDCDRPGEPAADVAVSCANEDGVVVVTLHNIGGQLPLTFTVQGVNHVVLANSDVPVTLSGLLDGAQTISITQGANDFSKPVTINCDQAPTVTSTATCVDSAGGISDGQVVVTLHNNGDDVAVVFTVNGVQYTVGPKASQDVPVGPLADGPHTIDVFVGQVRLGLDPFTVSCDHPGIGSLSVVQTCADHDGQVTINLTATGGELPFVFTVNGTTYSVAPNTTMPVVISGLLDGATPVAVSAGGKDLSFTATTKCDLPPTHSYVQACSNFDGSVSILIGNPGDDVNVTFTINDVDYVLAPGTSQTVVIDGLSDGENTITMAIDGVPQEDIVVTSHCDPVFVVTAVCNSIGVDNEVSGYWFTITNSGGIDAPVTWDGGSATVPAGQSLTVLSATAPLVLMNNETVIAVVDASESNCERTVTFTKELNGQPATGETYTIRVSRLEGDTYVEETTFSINAGESKVISLPSTLDPAGIDYKFEEIVKGTANTSVVSPDQLKLAGHLGETVNVVVTNGYASVQIDKASSTAKVDPGGQVTYTLQATNTGGLTLNPVVVNDRLPSTVELVSASVADGAGQCVLTEATRPQLLTCTMSGALAPAAVTSVITVVVKADATVAAGSTIVNQAMVHGAYAADAVMSGLGGGSELSCVPVVAGTVCDLSAQVGVPVSTPQVASQPPTPPTVAVDAVVAELPRTGAGHLREMLALGLGGILLGGAMLIGRRRIGAR